MQSLSRTLIFLGIVLVLSGAGIWLWSNLSSAIPGLNRIGRLPGDIYIRRSNFTFYFPLMTSIIVSIALTIIFAFLRR
jgi:hypothetical protein